MLYSHIASSPVVANFPAFAKRIANKELPHGADIILGIHARLLREPHPLPFRSADPGPSSFFRPSEPVELDARSDDTPEAEAADGTGPTHAYKKDTRSGSLLGPPKSSESIPTMPQTFGVPATFGLNAVPMTGEEAGTAVPAAAYSSSSPLMSDYSKGRSRVGLRGRK